MKSLRKHIINGIVKLVYIFYILYFQFKEVNYHGLSKVQKRGTLQSWLGERPPALQMQIMRILLYRGKQIGCQVARGAPHGAGDVFGGIGRILNISFGTVYQWIKKLDEKVDLPVRSEPVSIVELDEMHSYVAQKKTIDGHGLLLIDFQSGSSLLSAETAPRPQGKGCGTK